MIDIAIVNATILPMGGAAVVPNGVLSIAGTTIEAVGPAGSIDVESARRTIDARGRVLMPGFVNCHTHIASNMLMRGLLEDVQLFEWLGALWRMKQNFDPDTLYWASLMGLVEMVRSGITTFNEHFDFYDVDPQLAALDEIPLRATLGYGLADLGLYAAVAERSWATLHAFGDLVSRHHGSGGDRIRIALAPDASYSCSAAMFQQIRKTAETHGVAIHTHLSQAPQEIAAMADLYGMRPVPWLHGLGFLGPDVTAAHCTQLDDQDIAILAETGTRIAHCPTCNAKLSAGTLRLKCVCDAGITVGLATDGPASNNTLDLFQEMKFAGMIHKEKTGDVAFLKTRELLEMATRGAALAMNRPETGMLAPGLKADMIVVDLDTAHSMPVYDEAAALVYSARADDVITTIVDGTVLMEDRVMAGIDEADIRARFRKKALALRERSLRS